MAFNPQKVFKHISHKFALLFVLSNFFYKKYIHIVSHFCSFLLELSIYYFLNEI